ncbi:MAG: thioredoxin family protein [Candidatus Izimaplasma sp.]|nr:thioredoxin family protein [Candidatus Izimaplasma bacterium]
MKKITTLKAFYDAIENNPRVITYWHTKWCPDCFAIKPHLPKLQETFSDFVFLDIDRDKLIDLAKHLEIYGIPSFIIFKDGDEKSRLVNKQRKTYDEVKTFIETNR